MPIVHLPRGVRMTAALLQEIVNKCGTCNPCGSGSGSGGGILPCCPGVSTLGSWDITGTTGDAPCISDTQPSDIPNCNIEGDDLNGVRCGQAGDGSPFYNYQSICIVGPKTTTITIALC